MSVIRRRWHFTGNVQGVGFRYFAQCAAQKLGLTFCLKLMRLKSLPCSRLAA